MALWVHGLCTWIFVDDQAAQAYDIYLIIYVCVGITEADARGHT